MNRFIMLSIASVAISACAPESNEQKIQSQTAKVYSLNADERAMASANAKSYFEREWINAGNMRGQFLNCRPSDSNFNGLVSCFALVPQPPAGATFKEKKMYCGYRPEIVGCSDEDTVK